MWVLKPAYCVQLWNDLRKREQIGMDNEENEIPSG
jgi:hypothetical protein